ncbi:glycine cleavage system aminomethyltransferase GcvT [Desulfonatronum sp. SC1]|uniref:glycine cleavage system aminomethyltransferase GcvT n=1 Tax=Desulfonatronum sp. SC1 TaxID=2109626 RepID=UPI000D318D72|nr:glycine cleavage system aminomethyltransferase GcvT [Desulfonatronum sp. SC1]PTN38728.1 glycine cleavage system aminomethyltransferase GcvT [Desulfonatronum sp. SC1]
MLKTPLHAWHSAHQGRMVPFAGWDLPVQYAAGILAEHEQTRTRASVFDICHMGEFLVSGGEAEEALGRVVTLNLPKLRPGRAGYGFLLNQQGGILDDLIIYRLEQTRFLLVVNAARIDHDREWIKNLLPSTVVLEDVSEQTAKIDLQGPLSLEALQSVVPGDWRDLGYFSFRHHRFQGEDVLISRTGYTGELGYEVYLPTSSALAFWEACLQDDRARPAGLGARDTLRLEMGLPLYGQDLDEHHTPAEAGYAALLTSPTPYVGKERQMDVRERLIPLLIPGRRSARHGDMVYSTSGDARGRVTSGSFAPSLGHAVALAYVDTRFADDPEFMIRTGKAELPARRTTLPFYTQGTARIKL